MQKNVIRSFGFSAILCAMCFSAFGQHDHHMMQDSSAKVLPKDSSMLKDMHSMSHAFSLNLPMSRNGSGTGWMPDSTPMFGYMIHAKKWMYMFHGNVFARHNKQDVFEKGIRGDEKFDAINWLMCMGQRKVGQRGLFRFSLMMSLDNLFGGDGYPLLYQTGESWQKKPLVDRQHPHDLFSEVSVGYSYALNQKNDIFVYVGYPGEPALGSVAFMHRVSSLYGPDAPLSHHWNDGTHITFGVITVGYRLNKIKIEASSFTGREPDENRYDFDPIKMDSYSGRISYNPNPYWSFQVSEGFNKSPEVLHPDENIWRTTASFIHSKPLGNKNFLNVTGLWGLNRSHSDEHAALLEGALIIRRFSIYSRYEWTQKSGEELDLNADNFDVENIYAINALTVGMGFDLIHSKKGNVAIGGQGSYYHADSRLNALYGANPVSAEIFIRLYPPRMKPMKM